MQPIKQNRRLAVILTCATAVLFIPLIAMQWTNEVRWTIGDFTVAGILLYGTGFILEWLLRRIRPVKYRIIAGAVVFIILVLIWAELAVGLFGTPWAGN